jgi:hypothetical protein
MDTDVVAGIEAGLATVLVLSGVTRREDIGRYPFRPGRILDSVADALPYIWLRRTSHRTDRRSAQRPYAGCAEIAVEHSFGCLPRPDSGRATPRTSEMVTRGGSLLSKYLRVGAVAALGALALAACGSTTAVSPSSQPSNAPSSTTSAHAAAKPQTLIGGTAVAGRETLAISMGDSFISGEGASLMGNMYASSKSAADENAPNYKTGLYGDIWGVGTTNANTPGWYCHRSSVAEIHSAKLPGIDKTANLACSGATTADITTNSFRGLPPQITQLQALAKDPKYQIKTIVLSIGGNDLQFSDVIGHCVQVWQHNLCGSEGENEKYFTSKIKSTVTGNVVSTIQKIQTVMTNNGYAAGSYAFVLQDYPAIFAGSEDRRNVSENKYVECPGTQLSNETVDWANSFVMPYIASMMKDAASQTGVSFLDLSNAFNGHTMCDDNTKYVLTGSGAKPAPAERAEWVAALDPSPFWKGAWRAISSSNDSRFNESFHPNYYGQLALGTCLNKLMASGAKSASCSGAPRTGPTAQTLTVTG